MGVLFNPALTELLRAEPDLVDYVEIIPDTFWLDQGGRGQGRFVPFASWIRFLDWIAERKPLVAHWIGLSLGSAGFRDDDYLAHMARIDRHYRFAWHSDHLSFVQVHGGAGINHNAGLALPVPYDHDVLELVAEHIADACAAIHSKFLVENNVAYVAIPEQDMSEPEFLNRLAEQTRCGLLLDVHNVLANALNHRFDPLEFIDQLDLDQVHEVHIAGGSEMFGAYTDSHAGPCPEPVWELLDYVVPRAPALRGITFEFHESYYPLLKESGIREQLSRARQAWSKRQAPHRVPG